MLQAKTLRVVVAVESTYNWYWLVDGLMESGYAVKLVNTAAVPQYVRPSRWYNLPRQRSRWLKKF